MSNRQQLIIMNGQGRAFLSYMKEIMNRQVLITLVIYEQIATLITSGGAQKRRNNSTKRDDLRVQEVLEEPSTEHRHGALRKPPLRAADVVRVAKRSHGACYRESGRATDSEPEHGDVLAQPLLGSNLGRVAQLALYHAFQALEMLRHGPQSHYRERGGVAKPRDRLERGHHSLDLLVVVPVPLADLRKAS
jgi:hypothetical protein